MQKKIFINCNEATEICDKSQYCEASTMDKIKLSIHNFLCKKCHLYSEQNTLMTKIFKVHIHTEKKHLLDDEKEAIKKVIEDNL